MVAGRSQSQTVTSRDDEGPGFWEALKDMFMPDEDRATYAEGLRRGGYVVCVRTDAAHYEKAIDILDDEGTIDIEQRSAAWRNEVGVGTPPGSLRWGGPPPTLLQHRALPKPRRHEQLAARK